MFASGNPPSGFPPLEIPRLRRADPEGGPCGAATASSAGIVTTIAVVLFDGAEELDSRLFASGNPPSGFPPHGSPAAAGADPGPAGPQPRPRRGS